MNLRWITVKSMFLRRRPIASLGMPASLDAVAFALSNGDLDGVQAAVGDLAAAVDELSLDPRLRHDRPGIEPAK